MDGLLAGVEDDPNAELLHWLQCYQLAHTAYRPPSLPDNDHSSSSTT